MKSRVITYLLGHAQRLLALAGSKQTQPRAYTTNSLLGIVAAAAFVLTAASCANDLDDVTANSNQADTEELAKAKLNPIETGNTRVSVVGEVGEDCKIHWDISDRLQVYDVASERKAPFLISARTVDGNTATWQKVDLGIANRTKRNLVAILTTPCMNSAEMKKEGYNCFVQGYDASKHRLSLDFTGMVMSPKKDILQKYLVLASEPTAETIDPSGRYVDNYEFSNRAAFYKYRFVDEKGNPISIQSILVENVAIKADYCLEEREFCDVEWGNLSYNNMEGSNELYMVHVPGVYQPIFHILTTNGKSYIRQGKREYTVKSNSAHEMTMPLTEANEVKNPWMDDLIISEYTRYYINENSAKDFIEITNLTGKTVDLSQYTLVKVDQMVKKWVNKPNKCGGRGTWETVPNDQPTGIFPLANLEEATRMYSDRAPLTLPHGKSIIITVGNSITNYRFGPGISYPDFWRSQNAFYLGNTYKLGDELRPNGLGNTRTAFLLCKGGTNIDVNDENNNVVDNFNRQRDGKIGMLYHDKSYYRLPYYLYDWNTDRYGDPIPFGDRGRERMGTKLNYKHFDKYQWEVNTKNVRSSAGSWAFSQALSKYWLDKYRNSFE